MSKCDFFRKKITYLGYSISSEGLSALKNKLDEIANYPMPNCLKTAYQFCGICCYYTRYVPRLQIHLSHLQKLIAKKGSFQMTDEAKEGVIAVQKLARAGVNIHHLDYDQPIFIAADTSLVGIGGCCGNYSKLEEVTSTLTDIKVSAYTSRALCVKEALLSSRARELIGCSYVLEHFSDILPRDQEILVVTDHLNLQNLFDANVMAGKTSFFTVVRRALAVIMEFTVKFIYFTNKSELISCVDGLSRNAKYITEPFKIYMDELNMKIEVLPTRECNFVENEGEEFKIPPIPICPIVTRDMILREQNECSELKIFIEKLKLLKTGEKLILPTKVYFLCDELLCTENSKNFKMVVIQEKKAVTTLQYLHCSRDHVGVERLILFLNKLIFFVKNKYKLASEIVKNCYLCQLSKVDREPSKINQLSLRPSVEPFMDIKIDLMDFRSANQTFKYVLTALDTFSLFLDCTLINDESAVTVARSISILCDRYGLYGRSTITTDLGTEFINKDLEYELKRLNIPKLKISEMNPQSNRVERSHAEVRKILRTLLHSGGDLAYKVQLSVMKYNFLETKFLNYKSPHSVIYGYEPNFFSALFNIDSLRENDDDYTLNKIEISESVQKWTKYHENLLLEIGKNHFELTLGDLENLQLRVEKFQENDLVLVKFPQVKNQCSKMYFKYKGPFIVKKIALNSCLLECVYTRHLFSRNIRLIKKLHCTDDFKKMMILRNFSVKNNLFFPINTISEHHENLMKDVAEIDLLSKSTEPRLLRSGRLY